VARLFHVTSSLNRGSILMYGLDWSRMGAARGIAGSTSPEQEGCFFCQGEFEVEWFLRFPSEGTFDVWAVDGVDERQLVESPEGHAYLPERVPPERLELIRKDVPAQR
jgi:hypothetical protein